MSNIASELFKLNQSDVEKAIAMAVIGAFLTALQQMITSHGFDFAHYDWGFVFSTSVSAGIAYLMKNFLSTSDGKVLGKIG